MEECGLPEEVKAVRNLISRIEDEELQKEIFRALAEMVRAWREEYFH